jgi:hypothetical protein
MWPFILLAGTAVVVLAIVDALMTTLNVTERPAPVARTVLGASRRPLRAVLRGPRRAGVGLAQTVLMLGTWTALLWLGWWLVLLADPLVLVRSDGGAVAGAVDHLYVAGYGIFTLGTGDFTPATASAQLATVLAAGSGLALVTLEVTYLLGLTGAAQHKRRLARVVHGMGRDATQIVARSWNGEDFEQAAQLLDPLADDLVELAEHHAAFPVLHEFAASRRELAVGPAMLALLDAIHLMRRATPGARLPELPVAMVHAAVDELLLTMPELEPDATPPPAPGVEVLERLDIPVAGDTADEAADGTAADTAGYEAVRTRRRDLYALALHEGWPPGGTDG